MVPESFELPFSVVLLAKNQEFSTCTGNHIAQYLQCDTHSCGSMTGIGAEIYLSYFIYFLFDSFKEGCPSAKAVIHKRATIIVFIEDNKTTANHETE